MHIEEGIVHGAKMVLSYGTAAVSFGIAGKLAIDSIKKSGLLATFTKTMMSVQSANRLLIKISKRI